MHRRDLLKYSAASVLFATSLKAEILPPDAQAPGFFKFKLGDVSLTVLSDGNLVVPGSNYGVNADPADVEAFYKSHYLSTGSNISHTNHILIEKGDAKLLVDVGSGDRFMETAGRLLANMELAGIDPTSLTHVALTHAHPDHIWGVRDDFDESILPDAEFFMGETETQWWTAEGRADQVPEAMQQFVIGAQNSIQTIDGQLTRIGNDHEIIPGVRMIDTPGHTMGHMSLLIDAGDEQLLVTGDALNHSTMNFEKPEWVQGFDMDQAMTIETRKKLLDMAATDGMLMLGYHFPFPGVGHVMRRGDAYEFLPLTWQWAKG